jgi:hypothetical protein
MGNISDKFVEKIENHILYSIKFSENRGIMWKNMVQPDRAQIK